MKTDGLRNGFFFVILFFLPFNLSSQSLTEEEKSTLLKEAEFFYGKAGYTSTYDSSIYYTLKALDLFQAINDQRKILKSYNRLTVYYQRNENYLEYQKYAQKSWEYAQVKFDESEPSYISAKGNLAGPLLFKEDYSGALKIMKECLKLRERDSLYGRTAIFANNIGYFYHHHVSDYERALHYYSKALRLFEVSKEDNRNEKCATNANIASSLIERQLLDSAFMICQNTLDSLSMLDTTEYNRRTKWHCYQNMAAIYLEKEERERCLAYAQKALTIIKAARDPQLTYEMLGNYYLGESDYEMALHFFGKAVDVTRRLPEMHKRVNAACQLASALALANEPQAALDTLQRALQYLSPDFFQKDVRLNPGEASMLHKTSGLDLMALKGTLFFQKYQSAGLIEDLESALESFRLASELITVIRQRFAEDISKYQLGEKAIGIYEKAIEAAKELYEISGDEHYLSEAFLFAERNKSVSLLESIRENTAMGFGLLPDSLLQKEKNLKGEVTFYRKLIHLENQKKDKIDEEALKNRQIQLFELKEKHQDLIDVLEKNFPKYYQLKYSPHFASLDELQQQVLDANTILLEYFVGEHQLYLFCVSKEKIQLTAIPKSAQFLERFALLQKVLSTKPGDNYEAMLKSYNRHAPYLYEQLLAPVFTQLPDKINKVILIPDDFLYYLPFEALSTGTEPAAPAGFGLARQNYLLEDFQFSYHFSASLLLLNHNQKYKATKQFAGFAPSFRENDFADLRGCENGQLYSLQFNQKEVEAINELMDGKVFKAEDASKERFVQLEEQYDVLHLATHACLDEDNPQFNRIYFSDSYLSNFDLTNLSLKANLVVLSACNTSSGTLVKGDGVMSLSRGFTLAGCPSTLTSLWAVDDYSTSELMILFYQELLTGKSKNAALQTAKLNYLEHCDKEGAHPCFWAPFLQFGNTAPLDIDGFNWLWLAGLGGILIPLLIYALFRFNRINRVGPGSF